MAHPNTNDQAEAASMNGKMAVSPNAPEAVPDLVARISSLGESIALKDSKERLKLLDAARSLALAVETPREAILRHCWSEVGFPLILQIA